ncbi:hypothetical protein QYF61_012209 [Mycteria americana]|uniref:Uncharacterized protein n=1 Tax=Mycteria americana TaxID=33587 RepID=A0AAN7NE35_MYCAM|nr:hypothetical protein QYF61_012209 [Mycteria americana]
MATWLTHLPWQQLRRSKPPVAQLEAISSHPITCYLGEETDPHLSTTSFQAKQPQFPQPLLIRLLLQTLHQLRCPSLDTLQHLNVSLVVGGPKPNTGFEPVAEYRRGQFCLTSFPVTFEEEMECVLIKFAGDAKAGQRKCWRTELPFKGI